MAILDFDATFIGEGTTQASLLRVIYLPGTLVGLGRTFLVGVPEPAVGAGFLTAVLQILHLPPICVCGPKPFTFPFGHLFTRGDLTFQVSDPAGNPISPFSVTYALFRVLPSGVLLPFGDPQRRPIMPTVGEFYPSFRSDDLGQPGDWLIRWTYRESSSSATVVKDLPFRILDSVLAKDKKDATPRKPKHGWY